MRIDACAGALEGHAGELDVGDALDIRRRAIAFAARPGRLDRLPGFGLARHFSLTFVLDPNCAGGIVTQHLAVGKQSMP